MCGISGIAGRRASEAAIDAMVRAQWHRGPDDRGHFLDPEWPLALGHNRLSIIDLTADGRQPMASTDGQLWLVFNGEIYNYRELKAELTRYPYRSRTDSEAILAAYLAWGPDCVDRFVGMFAFAIWDRRSRTLFCARDRLGIKPFHYGWWDGSFFFASEIKGLLAAGFPARPDADTWAAYLAHGYYDHGPATFFENVRALEPGHALTLSLPEGDRGEGPEPERITRYWDLAERAAEALELDDDVAAERFLELLDDSVRLRLRSDVPVGVNLSGGLDSASLVVTVDRLFGEAGDLQTFTASFDDPCYDEREFAEEVPRRRGWARHVSRLREEDVWALARDAVWHQEAPFGGIATLAYHNLHGLAREQGITVLLEGQGVDELFAGYRYFRPHHHMDLLEAGALGALKRELRSTARAVDGAWRDLLDEVRRLREGTAALVYQDGTRHLRPECLLPEVLERAGPPPTFPRPFGEHLRDALYRDLRHTKLPRVLRMNDRLSMAFGRELREPYLDHRIVELAFRLPGTLKLRDGESKFLLRHAMRDRLPDSVRRARKRAVVTPQREWIRGSLGNDVEALLGSSRFAARGLVHVLGARRALQDFRAGEGSNAFFVWQWVNAELWYRRFVDGDVPAPGA